MDVAKQDFQLADLPTKSVVLFPSRARVVRSLENVTLKPGQNEIQIYGLTPTVDEHSIQVYGTGAATITDFTVELVPNREVFEDIFPEFDEKDDDAGKFDHDIIELEDCDEVKSLTAEIEDLVIDKDRHKETINNSTKQLETLDIYSKSLNASKNAAEDVEKTITMYGVQRERIFEMYCKAAKDLKLVTTSIAEKQKQKNKASLADQRRYDERLRVRQKEAIRKQLQKDKRDEENKRLREEKIKFWPKKVYVVTVNLESPIYTPSSSRRNSIDSVTLAPSITESVKGKTEDSAPGDAPQISLSLAYVTTEASWTPRYDINIDSTKKTASIAYRAELSNLTSEVWKDVQLILSTSQTSYAGIEDKIPFMNPWHVKLNKYTGQELLSPDELNRTGDDIANRAPAWRGELFGANNSSHMAKPGSNSFLSTSRSARAAPVIGDSTKGKKKGKGITFGSAAVPAFGSSLVGSSFGASAPPPPATARMASAAANEQSEEDGEEDESDNDMGFGLFDNNDGGSGSQKKALDYQESKWGDHGLTSTYELPGTRSLVPSTIARRHKIASLNASNINISHVLVAKLKPAAFLRTKIRNPSGSVTLLKGTAGITLDGSFIGNTTLKRVSPGALFEMSLGVDPAIQVSYPKPVVTRSTGGLFNKELVQLFSRNIWITNTKVIPIELTVLDQFPVSQDDRLTINHLQPKGFTKEGDVVRAGVAAKESASGASETSKNTAWGKGTATLRGNGQVAWNVVLEKKQACLLKLEYEARMPAQERINPA